MRISRDALYLVAGSALLLTTPVLQVARQNVFYLNWTDFAVTWLVVIPQATLKHFTFNLRHNRRP
jgi:hypothetical protein